MQHIKTPIDLVALECITKADVQQAIDTAYPYPKQGFVISSDDAPDVVADPRLAYFVWEKTVSLVPNGDFYYWNGSSWTLIPLVDGSKLANGSIPLTKLSLSGSSPYYIIQVDAAGTSLVWIAVVDAIQDNSIPPNKLVAPDNTNSYILTSIAGTKAFTLYADFFAAITSNSIPVDALVRGGADTLGFYLRTKLDGTAIEWANVDVANLAAVGATAGQTIRRNVGNTAWEFIPASSLVIVELTNGGTYYTLPSGGTVLSVAHGQGAIPRMITIRLHCTVANNGYSVDEEIDVSSPIGVYASLETTPLYEWAVDSTNIILQCPTYSGNLPLPFFQPKAGGDSVAFDPTKWKAKFNLVA